MPPAEPGSLLPSTGATAGPSRPTPRHHCAAILHPGCGAVPYILSKKVTQMHGIAWPIVYLSWTTAGNSGSNWVRYPMAQLGSALGSQQAHSASPELFHRSPHFQDAATPRPFARWESRQPILFLPAPGAANWDLYWQAPIHCATESQSIFRGDPVRPASAVGRLPQKPAMRRLSAQPQHSLSLAFLRLS